MEGNFLSRYNNKLQEWSKLIDKDPSNKSRYEHEMSEYMMNCMPYMNQHSIENDEEVNTDNIFNAK